MDWSLTVSLITYVLLVTLLSFLCPSIFFYFLPLSPLYSHPPSFCCTEECRVAIGMVCEELPLRVLLQVFVFWLEYQLALNHRVINVEEEGRGGQRQQ